MSRDDQKTQNQMVHLDTEIKELAMWLDNIAKMANILTAAAKVGLLKSPDRGDFPPAGPSHATSKPSEPGANRLVGEWHKVLKQML